jgi:LmbE family N-acetylglucosaminyl deacetylase
MAMITAGRLHRLWRALPEGSLDDVTAGGRCLILAPHPDDESLGCGGLIAACCAAARPPLVVILTDGSRSHPGSRQYPPAELAALREREVARAVAVLGLPQQRLVFLRQPDTRAPHAGAGFDAVAHRVAVLALAWRCRTILAPWRSDPHCDHEAAARIAARAAGIAGVRQLAYPVWGWTLPEETAVDAAAWHGWRLSIAPHLEVKRRAIAAHASQYGGLISDAPDGFRLPPGLLAVFQQPWETFLSP